MAINIQQPLTSFGTSVIDGNGTLVAISSEKTSKTGSKFKWVTIETPKGLVKAIDYMDNSGIYHHWVTELGRTIRYIYEVQNGFNILKYAGDEHGHEHNIQTKKDNSKSNLHLQIEQSDIGI